jgi:flagellar biosynthetic protein FlhB
MSDDASNKTEKPTPEKRKQAREEGQFPRGRDAGGIAASLAVLLFLVAMSDRFVTMVSEFAIRCYSAPFDLVEGNRGALAYRTFSLLAWLCVPAAMCAAGAALAIGFAEAGFQPMLKLVAPKWERLNPLSKLKELFSPSHALFELAMSLLRVVLIGAVVWGTLKSSLPLLTRLAGSGLLAASRELAAVVAQVSLRASAALAVLAIADYAVSHFRIEKSLMMSREEIKEELKQQEGDQKVKAQIRARARQRIRQGVVKQVKTADVVLANPTHVSVAIRYRPAEGAPVVVAKGYDEAALYIRKVARENGIHIMEAPPLARMLAKRVKVGRAVPVDCYAAVAEVLAFVYRLRGRGFG